MRRLRRFISNIDGTTSIEYGVIGVLIAVVIIVSVATIGTRLSSKFYTPVLNGLQ